MTPRRCLVLGSYPPIPGDPAAATVAAVRRAWAAGAEVVVASPRPSAAPLVLLRHGRALAREISRLRQENGCGEIVLCLEPEWPFVSRTARAPAAAALAKTLGQAARSEVVVTGDAGQWAARLDDLAPIWPAADVVTVSSEPLARLLRPRVAALQVREAGVPAGLAGFRGVSPLEPGELLAATRARRFAGRTARAILGAKEPLVRAKLAETLRAVVRAARKLLS